jgi:nitroimidazol reductase NimA-like FMN-containing flavoprotein (pyridoxamine 5'-phosphate oxidase superfamily)
MIGNVVEPRGQRRARRIAMSDAERDEFLRAERTCRVATVGTEGPHVAPLWFVWHDGALWLTSLNRSQRWTDLERDPRIAVVVDAGHDYVELRGVELRGRVEVVGEVPRTGEPEARLEPVERAFAEKYTGGSEFGYDGRHAWLVLRPEKIVSWDFRKIYA